VNEHELAARGQRADMCYNEFIGPQLKDFRAQYTDRMTEIAVSELDPKKRAEKITALATAIRILDNIDTGIRCMVEDGKAAQASLLRVDKIERMSAPRRRLFEFAPH
jgi:hypothetical protein